MANKQLDKSINLSGTIYDINAVNSDKATNDKNGNDITSYIKGLSISKKNITYTKGDGTTGTITTQDTSALVGGNGTKGLIKNGSTVTSSSGYTACPIISGVPYYKDTNSTYSLSSFGITATKEELNYVDGVTNNIQTQLNGKADSSHTHDISDVTNLQFSLNAKVPTSRTVNGKALSSNISLTASDVGAAASSHTHNYLEKTTYEKSAELACGSNGMVCLGKFGAYDTNITIELNCTTSTAYHATIVIHSQNVVTNGTGGTVGCYVYDDADNHITPLLSVFRPYGSASRQIEVYANLPGWSKNLVHVQGVALSDGGMTDVLTSVSSIPTSITGKQKVTPVNVLTTNFASSSHTHSAATTSAAGLMSASDKSKLDGIATGANKYSLPKASSSALGGVKIGFTESGRNYPVELNSSGQMYVNVPWHDSSYSNATSSLSGLMSESDKSKLDGIFKVDFNEILAACKY